MNLLDQIVSNIKVSQPEPEPVIMEGPVFNPTSEQSEITATAINESTNICIRALAGTGKSTTLKMIDWTINEPILYLAFGRRNVDEAEKERKHFAKTEDGTCFSDRTTIRTFNGLGHRAWMRAIPHRLTVEARKTRELMKEFAASLKGDDRTEYNKAYWEIVHAVDLAKNLGYVPEGGVPQCTRLISQEEFHASLEDRPTAFIAEFIDIILRQSIRASFKGLVDYNDQIYMPTLFGSAFPRFPNVFIDEYQDLNPINIEMLRHLKKSRLCAVGDDFQAIYAFRGAVSGALSGFAEEWKAVEHDLTICFRCPRAVVEACRWLVPKFKWVNDGGSVAQLSDLIPSSIPDGAAILCRNNAPLVRMAFNLLSVGRSVAVAGREIGPKLIGIMRKLGDGSLSRDSVLLRINGWLDEKLEKSNAPETAKDMAECMKIFASYGDNLDQACAYVEHLFKQQGTIKLSTIHKAKGLEWNNVYLLDPWLIRSGDGQDNNVRYVATTRAKQNFYEIDSARIKW